MITAADFRDSHLSMLLVGYDWDRLEHFAQFTLRQQGRIERIYRVEGLKSWSAFDDFGAQHVEQCTLLRDSDGVYLCLDPYREGERSQQDNYWFVGSRIFADGASGSSS